MFNKYILIVLWIGIMAMLQPNYCREEYNELTNEYNWRVTPLFAFIVMAPIILMSATRGWFADTTAYILNYRNMPSTFPEIPVYIQRITKDKGFYAISAVLRVILGYNYVPYLAILATFQAVAIIRLFRRNSIDYVFSIFLFIASTDYISWMFNGLRQFTAVTILLYAMPFILKKKWAPFIVIVLLASTVHQSALLMIPFAFISIGEPWNKRTVLFIIGTILAIVFVSRFTNLLDSALQGTQYSSMVSDYTEWQDDGTNPLRVLVYSIPAIISFIYRKKIKQSNDVVVYFCVNMSIISMGLYLISMVTSGIFMGRLPIYCSLYSYILLPWEIVHLFGENSKAVKFISVACYLLFYYYQMHIMNGMF